MKKKLIAVDLDDVISPQVDRIIQYLAEEFDVHLTLDHFKAPGDYWTYFERLPGINPDDSSRMFQKFLDTEQPYHQVVSPAAVKVIESLKADGYSFEVITSRGVRWQQGTEQWLEKNLPQVFGNIHFVEIWDTSDQKATKAQICKEIGAGYLIDDNPEHCNLADEAGVQALLFGEWGWNMYHHVRPGVIRVKDWQAVQEHFDEQG